MARNAKSWKSQCNNNKSTDDNYWKSLFKQCNNNNNNNKCTTTTTTKMTTKLTLPDSSRSPSSTKMRRRSREAFAPWRQPASWTSLFLGAAEKTSTAKFTMC